VGGRASAAANCGRDLHGSSSFGPSGNGLKHADIDVIRTGGPNVTKDVLAELVVSTRVLGSKEIMLLNHTGCGFTTFTDAELNAKFSKLTGDATPAPMRFFAFKNPD
jgi:carbonic anhydrase